MWRQRYVDEEIPLKRRNSSGRRSAAVCFRHHYLRSAELSGPSSESAFISRILSRISESPQSDEPSLNALARSAISGEDDCDCDGQVSDARVSPSRLCVVRNFAVSAQQTTSFLWILEFTRRSSIIVFIFPPHAWNLFTFYRIQKECAYSAKY